MTALGAVLLLVAAVCVVCLPRRWALLALVSAALYFPIGLHIELGFNLFALRILAAVGFARVISRRELSFTKLNSIDKALLAFTFYTTIVFLLRSPDGQVFEIGRTVDTCFSYFTFRALIRDLDEFKWFLRAFVVPLVPYLALVSVERVTLENPFNALLAGTAPFVIREGEVRAAGSFLHPSLLGTLGGSFLTLYLSLWLSKMGRFVAACGIVLCLMLVLASNSGAPLACIFVTGVGWACWPLRTRMRMVRYGMVLTLVALAVVMKAPIWYLLARFSELTGGDGYHRSYLLDISFRNLDKWWLAGMPIADTLDWFPYVNYTTGGADMTNQFLVWGITAGLGAIALWILILKRAFARLGDALTAVRARGQSTAHEEYFLWALGVLLAVHVMNWMSIPYFDQTSAFWFMELAIITNVTDGVLHTASGGGLLPAVQPTRPRRENHAAFGGTGRLPVPSWKLRQVGDGRRHRQFPAHR
jgi:hypothetical protein